jgi:hypothetical protein
MNKIKFPAILLLFMYYHESICQREGDQWVIGYGGFGSQANSVMHIDFSDGQFNLQLHYDETMFMTETSSTICDIQGQTILWTNGMEIFGRNGVRIADSIAYVDHPLGYWNWYYSDTYGPFGFPEHEGAIILPVPDKQNEYSILYHLAEITAEFSFDIPKYLEARVLMNIDSTFSLLYKDVLIDSHEYFSGTLIATRHANGRDWWIVAFEGNGKEYFSYILDPDGIRLQQHGEIDVEMKDGVGQAAFSGRGNYIARMDAVTLNEGQYINLFSFNRCNGEIERLETFHTEAGYFTGVAFSPSEQYLYADDNNHLWQWDLWSENIATSQTLVDTFDGFVQPGWGPMQFGPLIAAPDGRIYIVPPAGSSEFMHVIERPDMPASDCRFNQHSINLTVPNGRSAPNLPNYRLGPLDGSPCDTLGLTNVPVARWRYEEEQPGWRNDIRFTDLSFYEPQHWHWDFGDGGTSDEIHPVHSFENGIYHVCLTVSNENGSDSTCHWVEILPTSTEEESANPKADLSIDPNPFTDRLEIKSIIGSIRTTSLEVFDMHGVLVLNQPKAPVPVTLYLPQLPPGMYFFKIRDNDGTEYHFKVMKI